MTFTPIVEDKKRRATLSSASASSYSGLVTPINSTEVTPPSNGQFSSGQGMFENGIFDSGTPTAMQIDSDRGNEWEWWTMVM